MTTTDDTARFDRIKRDATIYIDRDNAVYAMERTYYPGNRRRWLVMGDAGQYWLVRPVDAGWLIKRGYELLWGDPTLDPEEAW